MSTGTVKWFDPEKGYGLITPDDGSRAVLIHASMVERCGLTTLEVGQKLFYLLRHDPKARKNVATDLQPR